MYEKGPQFGNPMYGKGPQFGNLIYGKGARFVYKTPQKPPIIPEKVQSQSKFQVANFYGNSQYPSNLGYKFNDGSRGSAIYGNPIREGYRSLNNKVTIISQKNKVIQHKQEENQGQNPDLNGWYRNFNQENQLQKYQGNQNIPNQGPSLNMNYQGNQGPSRDMSQGLGCLLYTSDAADDP